jgi:hypothetical protein
MNDDWRVQITSPSTATAANAAAGDRVVASVDAHEIFLYAATREQAEQAADAVKALAAPSGVSLQSELRRWHPVAEEWVDADAPLPTTDSAIAAEHAELIASEDQESAALHEAEWEVRVESGSHRDIVELAKRLRDEGIPSVRRWHFLLVGAADEDAAAKLAERIRTEIPEGSTVSVEGSYDAAQAELPPNPFAVFGGLGG